MKTLILGSVAATALVLSIGLASAQSQQDGSVTLTPEQRAIVRDVIREELQDRLGNRIADRLSQLSPAQREALRSVLKQRLSAEVREGIADRISDRLGAGSGSAVSGGERSGITSERVSGEFRHPLLGDRLAQLTPEQRAFVRMVMKEKIADELQERIADRIADGLSQLSPEQRDALRTALKQRMMLVIRQGIPDRLSDEISEGHGD